MTPSPSILVGLSDREARGLSLGKRLAGWVEDLGYEAALTTDAGQTLAWLEQRAFAASLLDFRLVADTGEQVWRRVRPVLGRRLVLMVREPRNDIWFDALRSGVGAVLPLPVREPAVRAALLAATRRMPAGRCGLSSACSSPEPAVEGMP
jgi:DNA-binding response OmpR family regulator